MTVPYFLDKIETYVAYQATSFREVDMGGMMGKIFGHGPGAPPPAPVAPTADNSQAAMTDAANQALADRATRGRASTILTSGQGVDDTAKLKSNTLLGMP